MQMDQTRGQEGDGNREVQQEYYHAGLDRATAGLSEADGVLLMELLELEEDSSAPPVDDLLDDDDVDRLSRVIRSLEAEIGSGGTTTPATWAGESGIGAAPDEDGGVLDDMLVADLYGYGGAAFGYWPEVPPEHVYTEEGSTVGYYADQQGSVEQMYSPLWE